MEFIYSVVIGILFIQLCTKSSHNMHAYIQKITVTRRSECTVVITIVSKLQSPRTWSRTSLLKELSLDDCLLVCFDESSIHPLPGVRRYTEELSELALVPAEVWANVHLPVGIHSRWPHT